MLSNVLSFFQNRKLQYLFIKIVKSLNKAKYNFRWFQWTVVDFDEILRYWKAQIFKAYPISNNLE